MRYFRRFDGGFECVCATSRHFCRRTNCKGCGSRVEGGVVRRIVRSVCRRHGLLSKIGGVGAVVRPSGGAIALCLVEGVGGVLSRGRSMV